MRMASSTGINATFDADENTLSFRTNKLDNFLVTNELIKDGTVVTEVDNDNSSSSDKEENTDKNNPTTGCQRHDQCRCHGCDRLPGGCRHHGHQEALQVILQRG